MDDQLKLGAVLIGGYLLGRTKKGGMALRLAARMAMSGQDVRPTALARDNATKFLHSAAGEQLRTLIVETAKATADARIKALAQNLTDRTEALQAGPKQAASTVKDTVTPDDEPEDEPDEDDEDQSSDFDDEPDEEPEPEDEDEEDEPEPPKKKAPAKKASKKAPAKKATKKSTTKKASR